MYIPDVSKGSLQNCRGGSRHEDCGIFWFKGSVRNDVPLC